MEFLKGAVDLTIYGIIDVFFLLNYKPITIQRINKFRININFFSISWT